jgi:hypothetical protein
VFVLAEGCALRGYISRPALFVGGLNKHGALLIMHVPTEREIRHYLESRSGRGSGTPCNEVWTIQRASSVSFVMLCRVQS